MLLVWADGIEDSIWIDNREVKDEEEAIHLMIDKGVWPDHMLLIDTDSTHIIPRDFGSAFEQRFSKAYREMCILTEEERDQREYARLKRKYECTDLTQTE